MKKSLNNEMDVLGLMEKIQAQLTALDKKVDALMGRSLPVIKSATAPMTSADSSRLAMRSNDHHKARVMHTAICADCKKECTIPFQPRADRPVYCKDCFSRRKVISLSGISVVNKPKEAASVQTPILKETITSKAQVKRKKNTVAAKKSIGKKKLAPKKK